MNPSATVDPNDDHVWPLLGPSLGPLWPIWRRKEHPSQTSFQRSSWKIRFQRIPSVPPSLPRSTLHNGPLDTTRAPRPGEADGVQYHFVSREDFVSLLDQGGFVEHAEFSGNLYGTSKRAIDSIVESGKRCILDIEVQVFFLVVPSRDIPFMFTVGRPSS